MKKILLFNTYYYPDIVGGAEISTQLLAEGLSKHFEVSIISVGNQKSKISVEKINNVKVYRIPCLNIYHGKYYKKQPGLKKVVWHILNNFNPVQRKMLNQLIKDIGPDIIHTQNLMGIGTYVWDLAVNLNIPIVHTTRDYSLLSPVQNKFLNRMFNKSNRARSSKVNTVVGISKFIQKEHRSQNFFKNADWEVIHNVVNNETYTRKARREKQPLKVGYFGQLEENKGIDIIVKAIEKIENKIIDKLIICGDGSQRDKIQQHALHDNRIIVKGKVSQEEVKELMSQVDLTLVPSKWEEPFGRVVIESYSQGTPVIASKRGGMVEIIFDKNMLFDPNNLEELRNKIKKIYNQSQVEIEETIQDSYQAAEKYKDNIKEHVNVYSNLVNL